MDSTPPLEAIVHHAEAAPLDAGFLAALRAGTFEGGVFRGADGRAAQLCIDAEGLWSLVSPGREDTHALTAGTWAVPSGGILRPDGAISLAARWYQLCAVELGDGTRLAVVANVNVNAHVNADADADVTGTRLR
jgi:hypothetical protein